MKYTYLLLLTSFFMACNDSKNNSNSTKKDISENTQSSTRKIDTTNIQVKTEEVISTEKSQNEEFNCSPLICYKGMVNGEKIYIKIENSKDYISSSYQESNSKKIIHLNDQSKNGQTILEAYSYENDQTTTIAFFEGVITTNSFKGTWFSADRSKSSPFELTNNVKPFEFSFDMTVNKTEDEYEVSKTIKIRNNKTNKIIQEFNFEQSDLNDKIIVQDMNFDNILDFRLITITAANSRYSCWLFNPVTKKFENSNILSQMSSPYFDYQNKQVSSFWKNGYTNYGEEIYQFQNNNYFLIEESTWEINANQEETKTINKYNIVNGKSVKIN